MTETILIKKCTACKQTKPVSGFGPDKRSRDGYRYKCNECRRAPEKKYRQNMTYVDPPKEKQCHICKKIKTASEFYKRKYRKNTLSTSCKDCDKEYQKTWGTKKRWQQKLDIIKILGGHCEECGYSGVALEFHHLNHDKEHRLWRRDSGFYKLLENYKIQLLCSNCHKELHNDKLNSFILNNLEL